MKYYPIIGMHCTACAASVERAVRQLPGVKNANISFSERILSIDFDPQKVSQETLADTVAGLGFQMLAADQEYELEQLTQKARRRETQRLKRNLIGSWIATVLTMITHFVLPEGIWMLLIAALSATSVYFYFALPFHRTAWLGIKRRSTSMDTLVSLSTTVSFWGGLAALIWSTHGIHTAVSYFHATLMIPAFVLLGKWLESRATLHTTAALTKLVASRPRLARLKKETETVIVPIEQLQPGDLIEVLAAEAIPVDGTLLEGTATIDEKLVSGEALPVDKRPGDMLYAGTINGMSTLVIRASSIGKDTVLGQIVTSVREAETARLPIRRVADRVAAIFVPVVLLIAIITTLYWLFIDSSCDAWCAIEHGISVLVVACPCALGLATPLAITVAMGHAATHHILVKDPAALELLPKVSKIFFDKTGTLTAGEPTVKKVEWFCPSERIESYIPILVAIEAQSSHPLAKAIVKHFDKNDPLVYPFKEVATLPGEGLVATLGEDTYRVGKPMDGQHASRAGSSVVFEENGVLLASFEIADRIPHSTHEALKTLAHMGIQVAIATGDHAAAADEVARQLNIREVHSQLTPNDKLKLIEQAQSEGEVVAMLGDGINDSMALSHANLSCAMVHGSDIAVSAAQLVLAEHNLTLLPHAIRTTQLMRRVIKRNFFWALIYNAAAIPIAAGFTPLVVNPPIAAALMAASSLSVVFSSLALNRTLKGIAD